MRRLTKIICTWGPATSKASQIEALARAGADILRFNLSHGKWEHHAAMLKIVAALNKKLRTQGKAPSCLSTLLDTKGAEVRTGNVKEPLIIKKGELVVFSPKPLPKERKQVVLVDHKAFHKDVQEADQILLDNGKICFELVSVRTDGSVVARAMQEGTIGSRRHVNLPGANLDMPSLTKDDWASIKNAADAGVDFIGLSFIRKAEEIHEVRKYLHKRGKSIGLIAKIETRQALTNLDEIIAASDAVMVARGDLGAEIPFEKLPVVQNEIVAACRAAGKPVIVATHMLESMIENPIPTRAEVTDIAHAATTYTDMTMLSGETASGAHPLLALDAMVRVLTETQAHLAKSQRMLNEDVRSLRDAQAKSAVTLALSSNAEAIIVITKTGQFAREISRYRPNVPVIAFTPDALVQHALQLSYGVIPLLLKFSSDPEKTVLQGITIAKKAGLLKKGQTFVLVSDAKAHELNVSSIQERTVV